MPQCVCLNLCNCDALKTVKIYKQNDYIIRFLKDLNSFFSSAKFHIMMMDPYRLSIRLSLSCHVARKTIESMANY